MEGKKKAGVAVLRDKVRDISRPEIFIGIKVRYLKFGIKAGYLKFLMYWNDSQMRTKF